MLILKSNFFPYTNVSYVYISCVSLLYFIQFVHLPLAYIKFPLVHVED